VEILLPLVQLKSSLKLKFAQNVIHFILEKKKFLIMWEGLRNLGRDWQKRKSLGKLKRGKGKVKTTTKNLKVFSFTLLFFICRSFS